MAYSNTGNRPTCDRSCDHCGADISRGPVVAVDGGREYDDLFFCSTRCADAHVEASDEAVGDYFTTRDARGGVR